MHYHPKINLCIIGDSENDFPVTTHLAAYIITSVGIAKLSLCLSPSASL